MSDMVEKVARAIEGPMVDMSPGLTPQGRLRLMAKAAIEAMREPTEAMVEVGRKERCEHGDMQCGASESWRAMIDEAIR